MIKNLFLFFAALGLFATLSKAQVSSVTGQYLQDNNILLNPGFESGIGKWTNSAGTFTADYTNFVQGKASGKIVLSSQALAFTQDSTSYVTALTDGVQGLVSVYIKSEFAAKVCSRSAGSTVTTNCVDVVGNNRWSLYKVPSILGATSNGISVNTNGTSVTGTIYIDESFVGITDLAADVDASRIAGEAYFAGTASCNWTRTSTTIGAFGTVAACPGPTIAHQYLGAWQTTDSDLPRVTVNNLPAGIYKAKFLIRHILNTGGGSGFSINDGTTSCEPQYGKTGGVGAYIFVSVECTFRYNSSGNRVFELYAGSTANTITVSNEVNTAPRISTKFILEYFGSSSVYTATANQNNVDVFSAKVSSTGVVSDENINWINGNCTVSITSSYTCTFNTNIFSFAPSCTMTALSGGAVAVRHLTATTSTTVNPYTFNPSSGAALAADFQIICQKQGADFTATRLITGQFKEVVTSPNITKPITYRAYVAGSTVTTACTTSPCTVHFDHGSLISSVTRGVAGRYTFTSNNGKFAAGSYVTCQISKGFESAGFIFAIQLNGVADSNGAVQSGTNELRTLSATGTLQDTAFWITCEGQAP
jgi:hypothetical protein